MTSGVAGWRETRLYMLPMVWVGDRPTVHSATLFVFFSFLFLSFLLSREGLLLSLSWLTSPHLEAKHCFMRLLNEEASFEAHSLAAHDRGQEETPRCPCQNPGACQGHFLHHLTHPPPRVCLAGFGPGILGKDRHSKSLQICLVCKAMVVLRQASPGLHCGILAQRGPRWEDQSLLFGANWKTGTTQALLCPLCCP